MGRWKSYKFDKVQRPKCKYYAIRHDVHHVGGVFYEKYRNNEQRPALSRWPVTQSHFTGTCQKNQEITVVYALLLRSVHLVL